MSGFFWIASFPKSGNTWVRLVLWSLKNGGAAIDFSARVEFAPIATSRGYFDRALGVESSDLGPAEIAVLRPRSYELRAENAAEPIFCKVHDACCATPAGDPLFPLAITLGIIHIVRDPRDVALSLAHHNGSTIDQAITYMAKPESLPAIDPFRLSEQLPQMMSNWSRHAESWLNAPGSRPPLLVRYEDMLIDPVATLAGMARYVGWPEDSVTLERAVAATRFDALRDMETRQGFHERAPAADRFFRRGSAGGWRNLLTPEQIARIEDDHGAMMARLNYR